MTDNNSRPGRVPSNYDVSIAADSAANACVVVTFRTVTIRDSDHAEVDTRVFNLRGIDPAVIPGALRALAERMDVKLSAERN